MTPGKWSYAPGLWSREDGARVERCKSGSRKGVWFAMLPWGEYIMIERSYPAVKQGYFPAQHAKHAIDLRIAKGRP